MVKSRSLAQDVSKAVTSIDFCVSSVNGAQASKEIEKRDKELGATERLNGTRYTILPAKVTRRYHDRRCGRR